MQNFLSEQLGSHQDPTSRFLSDRLSTGYYGVYDTALGIYLLRDAPAPFAASVARRLNDPTSWEPSGPQLVADAVRHFLVTGHPPGSADPLH